MYVIRYEDVTGADLAALRPYERRRIFDEIDEQLAFHPNTPSRRRKMLVGLTPPWDQVRPVWQIRVGEIRVFYDVDDDRNEVIIKAICRKGGKTTKEIL